MKIASVSQMREMDSQAVSQYALSGEILMENAGIAALQIIKKFFEVGEKLKVLILCGIGNNGGDGLVLARQLFSLNAIVNVIFLSSPEKFSEAAKVNFEIVKNLGIPFAVFEPVTNVDLIFSDHDLIIDAIFGTGLDRTVTGDYSTIIDAINSSGLPVLSLDIPSGIHGDTGQIMGTAIKAKWTITYGLPKIGNVLYPGYEHNGNLYASHISLPPEMTNRNDLTVEINLPPDLPHRPADGHKGTFGEILTIAGAASYYGAPYFSAMAFLKAGGGYSRLATPDSLVPAIAAKASEIVFIPLMENNEGCISLSNKDALLKLTGQLDFTILGPGCSLNSETQQLIRELITEIDRPILVDGDGLSALSKNLEILTKRSSTTTILTPHLGEMARLAGIIKSEISADPISVIRSFCRDWKVILVLKGAHSLIGYPDGRVYINMTGNSGMATAGSGDVLTGTIAAMFGLGLNIEDAIRKGVFIHGLAGDLAADKIGKDGITAQDILEALPAAMRLERAGRASQWKPNYQGAILI